MNNYGLGLYIKTLDCINVGSFGCLVVGEKLLCLYSHFSKTCNILCNLAATTVVTTERT